MSPPTSLSMVASPPTSGNGILLPPMMTEAASEGTTASSTSDYHHRHHIHSLLEDDQAVADFVGTSTAVKDLFSLPYTPQDQVVSVAIHNVEGMLIFDRDPQPEPGQDYSTTSKQPSKRRVSPSSIKKKKRPLPGKELQQQQDDNNSTLQRVISSSRDVSQALVALSSLEQPPLAAAAATAAPNNKTSAPALGVLNSFLEAVETQKRHGTAERIPTTTAASTANPDQQQDTSHTTKELGLPRPDHYVHQHIPPTPEPREYLSWKFHDMNLWVGSDALILREKDETTNTQMSLTVRVEDAHEMQALVKRHEHAVQTGTFQPDHQLSPLQQRGKPSYACAVVRPSQRIESAPEPHELSSSSSHSSSSNSCFSAPNLDEVRLQTCIVPCPAIPVGGLLDTNATAAPMPKAATAEHPTDHERATMVSPVSTVLDAYLDNIMANVPQLALCLREKGFVQSVKLLETESIPSAFLHPSTMDTSKPFDVRTEETEKVFSPRVMEMNATALLRFLKLNCSKDNATYLLRRERGQTNVNLYDISSISAMKQKKWIWWLAMMSCRFAHRLRNIGVHTQDPVVRRAFRNRERGLLQNALDLLEALTDMDGTTHESLAAGIRENLADTFLRGEEDPAGTVVVPKDTTDNRETTSPEPATSKSTSQQPYATLTVDALNKAYDHLSHAIKDLFPHFEKKMEGRSKGGASSDTSKKPNVVSIDGNSSDDSDEDVDGSNSDLEVVATATQLFALHEKIVNVSLRLAEIHLRNYYSSSAMQALRSAARRIASSLLILKTASKADNNKAPNKDWLRHLQLQFVWLWEHCGHFARSFAGDALWRDRGHAAADDILIVLQDAESAFVNDQGCADLAGMGIFFRTNTLSTKTGNSVNLYSLSGIVGPKTAVDEKRKGSDDAGGMEEARRILDRDQKFLKREERKAIIAACLAYQRAIHAFEELETSDDTSPSHRAQTDDATFLALLQQRLGDACNEAGKILMNELRTQLSKQKEDNAPSEHAAQALLSSAEFWFEQSLHAFTKSGDLKNMVLLRCNLCQCFKLRANALFAAKDALQSLHAEGCLQEAANQLEAAHACLGERGTEPSLWDMVSAELAATFLVLGVRRRQSLIGSGNTPLILQSFRLSPGQERSVVDPMQRALTIYESSGNLHQAAAAHYQLALFFSKVWTCQRDETKTREKLGAAFQHYNSAHSYFSQAYHGNELTLCLVCLDLSNLYSSVQGEEGNAKALLCCLDTVKALEFAVADEKPGAPRSDDWYVQMDTVAASVEERVFKSLRNLVKLLDDGETTIPYKEVYRASLTAKMRAPKPQATANSRELVVEHLSAVHAILKATEDALPVGLK